MAPEQPKKVTGGAFGRFMAENRAALIKECAGQPATASIKLGSARFKALSAAQKQKYEKQYQAAKQQYEKDLAAFKAAGGEMKAIVKKSKKEKKTKDPNKPKKPAGGAYGCYLAKHRPALIKECVGQPITAVAKLAGQRWKLLSDAQKKPFEAEYGKKKAAYEKAMKDYVPPASPADEGASEGEEDEDDEEEEEDDEDDEDKEESEEQPAAKKAKTAEPPAAKKSKAATGGDPAAEAKSLGYARQFSALSENPKLKNLSDAPKKILDALIAEKGKAVAAKKALLGA